MKISPYGICLAIATIVWLMGIFFLCKKRKISLQVAQTFALISIVSSFVFSRLIFCLVNIDLYLGFFKNPGLMLLFFDGGFSLIGVWIGLFVSALIVSKLQKIKLGMLMDIAVVPLGLWLAIVRFAESFTTLGVGKVVEKSPLTSLFPFLFLKETMGISVEYRMAVYVYEAGIALILFVIFALIAYKKGMGNGKLALLFFTWHGAIQVILESFRDDGHLLIIFLRVSQVFFAFLPIGISIFLSIKNKKKTGNVAYLTVLIISLILLILLEFSLDGRLTIGTPSFAREYGLMLLACLGLSVPTSLLIKNRE